MPTREPEAEAWPVFTLFRRQQPKRYCAYLKHGDLAIVPASRMSGFERAAGKSRRFRHWSGLAMRSPTGMTFCAILSVSTALVAELALAAPVIYTCEFKTASDRAVASRPEKRPLVKEYVYDPAAGGGFIEGNDLEVLVVKGADAISFVTKGKDGSVDSTTISKKSGDNKLPAVFSSHRISNVLEPKQWYGLCTLSQRG